MPAVEIWGVALGLREGVILLIALVGFYMLFVLLRMRRLRNKSPAISSAQSLKVADEGQAQQEPLLDEVAALPETASRNNEDFFEDAAPSASESVLHFGLTQEVAQLREEVDAIRGELAALRQELQQEVAHLHSAQSVAPIYSDAMQMAQSGYDPVMIADRCGIARAEAELVVALAKSQSQ